MVQYFSMQQIKYQIALFCNLQASYTVPTSSVTGYSNKPPATVASTTDIPRYQQPSQTPMSRHE